MSIRSKILLIWAVAFAIALALMLALFYAILSYPLGVVDRENAQEDNQRARNAILGRLGALETAVGDWAPWDDTYRFVADLNPEYIEANLSEGTLMNLEVNVMAFLDTHARIVYGRAIDLETGELTEVPDRLDALMTADSPLLTFTEEDTSNSGVVMLPGGPLLAAAQPILTSEWEGPARGSLVFGRFLDDAEIEVLSAAVRLPIDVFTVGSPELPEDVKAELPALEAGDVASVARLSGDGLASYGLMEDVGGSPALVFRVTSPRLAFESGESGLRVAVAVFLALAIVMCGIALWATDSLVTSRLSRLTSSVLDIAQSGDASGKVEAEGNDELPVLARAINRMLEALGQSQTALRSSEERFRAFFASAGDCIYVKDLSLRYTLVNPAMAEMLGRKPVDVVFRTDEELIADRAEVERLRAIDLRGIGGEVLEEERATRVGNRERVLHRVTAPMRDEKGSIIGVYTVARDITPRVVAERAVLASEQRYRMLLETLQEGILVTDQSAVVTYVNPRMAGMLGYTPVEMLRRPLSTLFDGEAASLLTPELLAQGQGGRESRELELNHKNGGTVTALLQAGPIHDGEGHLVGAIAAVQDLSEVRAAEGELLRLRELHKSIVQTAFEGIAVQGADGRFVFINPAAERMLGYAQRELAGESWTRIVPDDQQVLVREADGRRTRGEADRYELEIVRKDGVRFPVMVSGSPLYQGGGFAGTLAVFTDIGAIKRAQRELESSHRRFLAVLDGLDADVYVADMETYEILFMNRHMQEVFGADLVGKTCWKAFRNGKGPCEHCTNARLAAAGPGSGEVITWEGQNPLTGRHYLNYDRAIEWVDGRVVRLQLATDISERKAAEEALRESERKYRTLFNQVADPVLIVDGETRRIIDCNEAALAVYGFSREELSSMNPIELVAEDERETALASAESQRVPRLVTTVHQTKPGMRMDVELRSEELTYQGRPAWISVVRDITEHKQEEKRLSRLANFDSLTGLANPLLFDDRIGQALARAERSGDSLALLYIDLDHFKEVNDRFGHAAGNDLLKLVAGRLQGSVRKVDTVARLGGDEFTILLEGIRHPKDAMGVAEKVLDRMQPSFAVAGAEVAVTTSIGLALFPQDARNAEGLLRCADIALYHAKGKGRNAIAAYTPGLGERRHGPSGPVR